MPQPMPWRTPIALRLEQRPHRMPTVAIVTAIARAGAERAKVVLAEQSPPPPQPSSRRRAADERARRTARAVAHAPDRTGCDSDSSATARSCAHARRHPPAAPPAPRYPLARAH